MQEEFEGFGAFRRWIVILLEVSELRKKLAGSDKCLVESVVHGQWAVLVLTFCGGKFLGRQKSSQWLDCK